MGFRVRVGFRGRALQRNKRHKFGYALVKDVRKYIHLRHLRLCSNLASIHSFRITSCNLENLRSASTNRGDEPIARGTFDLTEAVEKEVLVPNKVCEKTVELLHQQVG